MKPIKLHWASILPYFIITPILCYSQTDTVNIQHDDHENALFEIGISSGPVYLVEEREFTAGFHTHITKRLKKIPLSVGLGYEYVLDKHRHHSFGAVFGYSPVKDFNVSVSPGLRTSNGSLQFTSHFEATYGFDLSKRLHLGPLIEYAYGRNDNHITVGAHVGILVNRKHKH